MVLAESACKLLVPSLLSLRFMPYMNGTKTPTYPPSREREGWEMEWKSESKTDKKRWWERKKRRRKRERGRWRDAMCVRVREKKKQTEKECQFQLKCDGTVRTHCVATQPCGLKITNVSLPFRVNLRCSKRLSAILSLCFAWQQSTLYDAKFPSIFGRKIVGQLQKKELPILSCNHCESTVIWTMSSKLKAQKKSVHNVSLCWCELLSGVNDT